MFVKKEGRESADGARHGQHCDLCGCANPAVRCDKCNSQIFCLSCDDMYHRHPKRRTHLRKAVDSFNPQAVRPVTPNKPPPGDPAKMPIPPPRKKKPRNFFGTLIRASSPNQSPVLPKKEFSWMDKFGTIKRFMSHRPLPPLPVESSPSPEPLLPLGTIYQNVPDASEKTEVVRTGYGNSRTNGVYPTSDTNWESDRRPTPPPKRHQCPTQTAEPFLMNRSRGHSLGEVGKWASNYPAGSRHGLGMAPDYATFRKLSGSTKSRSPSPPTRDGSASMHQSSSLTDLNSSPGPYPYYPHQPYLPVFPAHSYAHLNCPQCYVGAWTPSVDNCQYCHSDDKRGKVRRSQSLMYDQTDHPVPYFPFAPGCGPFFPHGHRLEAPPSPSGSARCWRPAPRRSADDNASVASSTRSRGKSTSSGPQKSADNESTEISTDEEEEEGKKKDRAQPNLPLPNIASTPLQNPLKPWMPNESWSCEYCTYINPPRTRICTICCKTISNMGSVEKTIKEEENLGSQKLNSSDSILESAPLSNNSNLTSENNVSQLTSALEEAEKRNSKGRTPSR